MYIFIYTSILASNTVLEQISQSRELVCIAHRRLEFGKSRLDATVTEDELIHTAMVVIAIITVCDTLSVVASLEVGSMAASYSIFVCGNVVMMVALALNELWYILYAIVLSSAYHLNHLIENAFTPKLSSKWLWEIGGRTAARVPTLPGWTRGFCWAGLVDCLGPFRRDFHDVHLSRMHHQSRGHVRLHLCCAVVLHFSVGGLGMNPGAIWLESLGTAEFNFTNTSCWNNNMGRVSVYPCSRRFLRILFSPHGPVQYHGQRLRVPALRLRLPELAIPKQVSQSDFIMEVGISKPAF